MEIRVQPAMRFAASRRRQAVLSRRVAGMLLALLPVAVALPAHAQLTLAITDRHGTPVASAVDGSTIHLVAQLATPARRAVEVVFRLAGHEARLGRCTVARGMQQCASEPLRTLGWHWDAAGKAMPLRTVVATAVPGSHRAAADLRVTPRPVVLVHGFISNAATWQPYTRANGFLAAIGAAGFAVGDGQVEGTMSTGDIARPTETTGTLRDNATVLRRYIAGVKQRTGAAMVDLVAHSMGGLIARYYIARLMPERDVAQLVMLGSPHGGSDCSGLPSALGMYGPASLELRPAYLRQIFNGAVTQRHGVPFSMLAGNPIVQNFKAPCTGVPSDIVVAQDSAAAIPGPVATMPVLHTEMTRSPEVFERYVRPLLQRPAAQFADLADPRTSAETVVPAQFTQVASGRVPPGGSAEIDVNLDEVAVASFALFDPSRSLTVTVRGASGNVITLNARDHGLIRIDDPATLVHLGYGFDKPRPGPWKVALQAQPGLAADYALSARVVGGAHLRAQASELTPTIGQAVAFSGALELPGRVLTDVAMEAVVHLPNGRKERLDLIGSTMPLSGVWRPTVSGIHGVDVIAKGRAGDLRVERTTFLAVEVR